MECPMKITWKCTPPNDLERKEVEKTTPFVPEMIELFRENECGRCPNEISPKNRRENETILIGGAVLRRFDEKKIKGKQKSKIGLDSIL